MPLDYAELGPVSTFGVPIIGGAPGLLPFTGNYFWVNETTGSDGNTGAANAPYKTLGQALSQCVANQNDVVLFTGTVHLTADLNWNKNQVHLIGLDAPLKRGKRARLSSSGTAYTPMFTASASGCWFYNFATFYGFNSASNNAICWSDTGGRNCYDLMEFMGFGDGTASTGTANILAARALTFNNNTGESSFRNCVFGVDTTVRNVANYTIEIAGGAPRLYFENCDFEADLGASGTGSSHVLINTSGIDRYIKFKSCTFGNFGANAMAQVLHVASDAGAPVILDQCVFYGATAWQTSPTANVLMNMVAATTGGGKAVEVF